jgi:hypothetical protein
MSLTDFALIDLLLGFGLNLLVALIIVRGIYSSAQQSKESTFTFVAFNTVIYFVMTFLANTELSVGVGFGLFAIFSLLRYRTSEVSTREMTYLFILIALPVMNSVLMSSGNWTALLVANGTVMLTLFVLERGWGFHYESSQQIRYDRIELIRPENHALLLADLRQRTGHTVKHVELGRINFVEDVVDLTIYFDIPISSKQPVEHEPSPAQEQLLPLEQSAQNR